MYEPILLVCKNCGNQFSFTPTTDRQNFHPSSSRPFCHPCHQVKIREREESARRGERERARERAMAYERARKREEREKREREEREREERERIMAVNTKFTTDPLSFFGQFVSLLDTVESLKTDLDKIRQENDTLRTNLAQILSGRSSSE